MSKRIETRVIECPNHTSDWVKGCAFCRVQELEAQQSATAAAVKALVFGEDYFVSSEQLDQINKAYGSVHTFDIHGEKFTLGDIIHTATAALKTLFKLEVK